MELPKKEYYTVDEWLSWDENVRSEIIDGQLIMCAQPTVAHQRVLMEISRQLANFLKGKPCQVFPAPLGVRLRKDENTAFEPDIVVICDNSKLDGKICNGAPDLVVEILSPSTERMDRLKFNKYLRAGVREYWIVDADEKYLTVYTLENGKYAADAYGETDAVPVGVLDGCVIDMKDVFEE
jgi:Uma2 family endonuclease